MTGQERSQGTAVRKSLPRGNHPLLIGLAAVIGGYLLGSGSDAHNQALADRVEDMLKDKELVPVSIVPPAVSVSEGGWALVGGADDRYYIVRVDGTTMEVMPDRRRYLLWR